MRRVSAEERFWSKVAIPADVITGCWLWTGKLGRYGYAIFSMKVGDEHKGVRAHRFSYEAVKGSIPSDLIVRHVVCRNRACVNPTHLELGTHKDNADDRERDGTTAKGDRAGPRCRRERMRRGENHPFALRPELRPRGEQHGQSKLTEEQVREIRQAYAAGGVVYRELAVRFGVDRTLIGHIVCNRIWRHVQ